MERGLLLHGGLSDSGGILDDLWLFDLTNYVEDVGPCPWIELNAATGTAIHSAGMAWDGDGERLVMIGGYEDDGSSVAASNSIRTLTLANAISGAGFSYATSLPDVEYTASIYGDESYHLSQIAPGHCAGSWTPEVPCVMNGGAMFDVALTGACDGSGNFKRSAVQTWGSWDACAGEASCTVDGIDYTPDLDLWPGCQDDPQCDGTEVSGVSSAEFASESLGHLAEVDAIWDPATGDVIAVGGTTGCTGACSAFPTSLFDLDRTAVQSLAAANRDSRVTFDGTNPTWTAIAGTSAPSTDWPVESTFGRRATAVAAIGLDWDYDSMSASSSGVTPVLVGGTTEQAQAPGVQQELTCGFSLCNDLCIDWESSLVPLDKPHTSDLEGLVAAADMVGTVGSSGAYTAEISMTPRMYVAAASLDNTAVLAVGGLLADGTASDALNVLDLSAGTNTETTGTILGPRWGAAAANDPLGKAVWVFGGQAGDTGLYRVTDTFSVAPELAAWTVGRHDGTTFDEGEIEVFLDHDGTGWEGGARYDIALDCEDCWAEDLLIRLATEDAADMSPVTMSVTYSDDTGTTWPLVPVVATFTDGGAAKFRLPRVVGPEHVLDVEISHPMTARTEDGFGADLPLKQTLSSTPSLPLGLLGSNVGEGTDRSSLWVLKGIPALPANTTADTFSVSSTLNGPSGTTPVGQGEPAADGVTFGPHDGVARWSYQALVLESLEYQTFADPIGGGARVHYWTDQLVQDDAGLLSAYVLGEDEGSASSDLDLLVSRLGPHPQGHLHLLFLRHGETSTGEIGGVTGNGLAAAFVADQDGTINDTSLLKPLHEAVHFWLGSPSYDGHAYSSDASAVLAEGVPRLLEFMREPNHTWELRVEEGGSCSTDADCDAGWTCDPDGTCARYASGSGDVVLRAVATGLNERDCLTGDTRLEVDDEEFIRYWANAYVWLQLIELHRADGNLEADFWQAVQDELGASPALTESSVRSVLESRLGRSGDYDDWFDDIQGKSGTPLVAIGAFDVTADTGGAIDRSLEVDQVQTAMYTSSNGCAQPADEFSAAPFVLGCDALDDQSLQAADSDPTLAEYVAFDECQFIASIGTGATSVYATSGPSLTLSLTPNSNLTVDPMPARFALGASDTLLPGWEDTFAADSSDWHRRCDAVSAVPGDDCYDADGDGFPNLGDCDSLDPAVHPDQPPNPDGSGTDYNCDGWIYSP